MTRRILLVDDEQSVLDGLRRQHRKAFDLVTACGVEEGLKALGEEGPFAVVVTDFNMPIMNGVQFLTRVQELAPETVRVMLTGQADMSTAIDAINGGRIFRFLTKPCEPAVFTGCIEDALEQWRLRHAEQELLQQTVRGSIEVLSDVMALSNPSAFGKGTRILGFVRHVVGQLGLENAWRYETAALLSQIGCVAIPDDLLDRMVAGEPLTPHQVSVYDRHPEVARKLLAKIPRLRPVAEMIYQQMSEAESTRDKEVLLGARILGAAAEFDEALSLGATKEQALVALRTSGQYPSKVITALTTAPVAEQATNEHLVPIAKLKVGMVLAEDLHNRDGNLIVGRGQAISAGAVERLKNYAELDRFEKSAVRVEVKPSPSEQAA